MKTTLMLMITLSAPAMALELPDPMESMNESVIDRAERLDAMGRVGRYRNPAPEVVVPIPPSESGPSYYSQDRIMTDKQFCNRQYGGAMWCYSR